MIEEELIKKHFVFTKKVSTRQRSLYRMISKGGASQVQILENVILEAVGEPRILK